MEKIILDTDIFIDYFRGVSEAESYIENLPVDKRGTTDVTLMELFSVEVR
jgi:predicted nucleic acid-binding protein